MLLRYRAVIRFGRHGTALLSGLAVGAVLMGSAAVVPTEMLPATWVAALGTSVPTPPKPPTVTLPERPQPPTITIPRPTPPSPPARPSRPAPPPPAAPPPSELPKPDPVIAPSSTPAPPRAPATVPSTTGDLTPAGTSGVVSLTNTARAKAGCRPLRRDDRLDDAALRHSLDMSTKVYFSHDSKDGRTFSDRILAAGYTSPGGENIARGQTTAAEVVQAWMDSPGHRRNILDCTFTTIGVGYAQHGDYWTQDFGR